MKKETVILRRCSEYDPGKVLTIIGEGIEAFGLAPRIKGKVTIKPSVVFAHHKVAPSAYTRSEFMDGLLGALEHKASSDAVFTIAEKCGAAIPTSRMFGHAGYCKLKKKHRVRVVPIEEAKKVRVPLAKGVLHKDVCMSRDIAQRDFLVYAPKLKTNVLAHGMTASIKLNIGILCDKEPMWNHNYRLDEKIVDMLEVGYPDFIATDGVEAVIGDYKGDVEAKRVFLLGMCTKVKGKIKARRKIRIKGCLPKHKTIVLWLFLKAGILNPLFRPDLIIDSYFFYFLSWMRRIVKERL